MPGTYTVSNRQAQMGRAGLLLPYTPTQGPLRLADTQGLDYFAMSKPAYGNAANYGAGIYTTGISDCSVIAIVERTATGWGRFYFEHLAGSVVTSHTKSLAAMAINGRGPNCCAVVGQYYGGVAFSEADELFDFLKTPKAYRSYYISGLSGMSFGLRFDGGEFGEVNP